MTISSTDKPVSLGASRGRGIKGMLRDNPPFGSGTKAIFAFAPTIANELIQSEHVQRASTLNTSGDERGDTVMLPEENHPGPDRASDRDGVAVRSH